MIMAIDLYYDLVDVSDYNREEPLPVIEVARVGPLRFESAFEFDSKVHMTGKYELPLRLRVPDHLLYPIKLIIQLCPLCRNTFILLKVHDCIES